MLTLLETSSQLLLSLSLALRSGVRMCPQVFRCIRDSRQCLENTPPGKGIAFYLELLKTEQRQYVSCYIIVNGSVL